jgi:hypothetical protein
LRFKMGNRGQEGLEAVSAAEIAGIADNESVPETPLFSKFIALALYWPDLVAVGPICNDGNSLLGDPALCEARRHTLPEHDIGVGISECYVAQAPQQGDGPFLGSRSTYAESCSNLRKEILKPVDVAGAFYASDGRCHN